MECGSVSYRLWFGFQGGSFAAALQGAVRIFMVSGCPWRHEGLLRTSIAEKAEVVTPAQAGVQSARVRIPLSPERQVIVDRVSMGLRPARAIKCGPAQLLRFPYHWLLALV